MKPVLITGGGGFIGGHTVRRFLEGQWPVRVLDDFSTGHRSNLEDLDDEVEVVEGSILDRPLLSKLMDGVQAVVHLAALPSVPRSVADPWPTNERNVDGTLAVLLAAREAGVARVVCASSSSVYGAAEMLPLHEGLPLKPLSPYAVSKATGELYGEVFSSLYDMEVVMLRYFNVFGPRQDPDSPYAAVIPKFIARLLENAAPQIYGDGRQARDFTYVANVAELNYRAATMATALPGAYNVACGGSISLNDLATRLSALMGVDAAPEYLPPRPGDIPRSQASIEKVCGALGYELVQDFEAGLRETVAFYAANRKKQ